MAINRPNRHLFCSSLAPDIDSEIPVHIEMQMEDSLVALHTSFHLEGILHQAFSENRSALVITPKQTNTYRRN